MGSSSLEAETHMLSESEASNMKRQQILQGVKQPPWHHHDKPISVLTDVILLPLVPRRLNRMMMQMSQIGLICLCVSKIPIAS